MQNRCSTAGLTANRTETILGQKVTALARVGVYVPGEKRPILPLYS